MSGDRWVVRYPTGEWGVEKSSRRTSHQLFSSMEDALAVARQESAAAGGGDVAVQAPDGSLSLSEQVRDGRPAPAPRPPRSIAQDKIAWTVLV